MSQYALVCSSMCQYVSVWSEASTFGAFWLYFLDGIGFEIPQNDHLTGSMASGMTRYQPITAFGGGATVLWLIVSNKTQHATVRLGTANSMPQYATVCYRRCYQINVWNERCGIEQWDDTDCCSFWLIEGKASEINVCMYESMKCWDTMLIYRKLGKERIETKLTSGQAAKRMSSLLLVSRLVS